MAQAVVDPARENVCHNWVLTMYKNTVRSNNTNTTDNKQKENFNKLVSGELFEAIQDGVMLCELLNGITGPNETPCKKFKSSQVAFVCRQNIEIFLKGCKAIGVAQNDLFETRDLFDIKDSVQGGQRHESVLMTLEALSVVAEERYNGIASIGAKRAHKNVRNFSQATLNKSKSAVPMWNQGDRENDTSGDHDSYGIIKNKNVTKHSGVQSTWEKGSLATNTSGDHDSYGIIKNKNVTKHSGVQSTWEKGSLANDTSSQHDSYGIIKNKNVTQHSGVQSTWEKGSLANDTGSQHDSYGIIKNQNVTQHSGVQSTWEKGSLATDNSSGHDSYGVVRQPNHMKK